MLPANTTNSLFVFPNPADNTLNIAITAKNSNFNDVFITDITGKRVQNIFKGKIEVYRKFEVNLNLAPGIYFVISASDSGIDSKKLIISK